MEFILPTGEHAIPYKPLVPHEKRRNPRFLIPEGMPAHVQLALPDGTLLQAKVLELSRSGIGVMVPPEKEMQWAALLHGVHDMTLALNGKQLPMQALIVWLGQGMRFNQEGLFAGVNIEHMNVRDELHLIHFIDELVEGGRSPETMLQ